MLKLKVDVGKIEKLKLGLIGLLSPETKRGALWAIGEEIRDHIARYPPPPRYPLRWASQKQKFYVLRILRKNLGKYVRRFDPMSQDLGGSWTVAWDANRVVVGTRVTYAPYVQSAKHQQPFHRDTGWVTDEQVVKEVKASKVIEEIVSEALRNAWHRVFR
jgi:hypothetical protein